MRSYINLLPAENQRRLMLHIRVQQWSLILCVVIATGMTLGWTEYLEHLATEKKLDLYVRTYEPIALLNRELDAMKKQVKILDQQEIMAAELVDRHPALTLLGEVARSASQCGGRLHIRELRLGRAGEKGFDRKLGVSSTGEMVLIKGTALDITSVTRFVDALRGANLFTQVDMKPTTETTVVHRPAFDYFVACTYQ